MGTGPAAMTFRCIGPFFVLFGMAMASVGNEARAADKRPAMSGLEALPFKERCLLATVLGREMRDLLSWVDPRRLPGVMGDDGFGLLVVPASGEQIRSVFQTGEGCAFALDRTYPNPGKIEVRLAEDPPPLLPPGRSYALLFARELDRGTRWQFDWSLSAVGYAGCPADQKTDHGPSIPAGTPVSSTDCPRRTCASPSGSAARDSKPRWRISNSRSGAAAQLCRMKPR